MIAADVRNGLRVTDKEGRKGTVVGDLPQNFGGRANVFEIRWDVGLTSMLWPSQFNPMEVPENE